MMISRSRTFSNFFLAVLAGVALFVNGCAHAPRVSTPPSFQMPAPSGGIPIQHTVIRGETLYRIAKTYNVDVSDVMRANHIYNPTQLASGQILIIPQPAVPVITPGIQEPITLEAMEKITGPKKNVYPWETITVHHSGTLTGSARLFDKDHRRRKMGGLFYHFVIGNGTRTPEGSVELGWRWLKQVKANRPNDIQICLVGNFDEQNVSERQLNSLVNLTALLQHQYNIPLSAVRQHCDIPGKHTDCPGKKFPFSKLLSKLSQKSTDPYFRK